MAVRPGRSHGFVPGADLFQHPIDGFHNRALRQHGAGLRGVDEAGYTPGQMTYDLRRLRLNGPAIAWFSADDAVLPFPLRSALLQADAPLDELIHHAFPAQTDPLANPFTKFANFFLPSNSHRSNHLPSPTAFFPAALRLPVGYNVASGGLRESDFAPRKADSEHDVPFALC